MQCPSCGAELVPGDAFCGTCGADVRIATEPPQSSQAPGSDQVSPAQQMPPPPPPVAPPVQPVASHTGAPPPPLPVAPPAAALPPLPSASNPQAPGPPPLPGQPADAGAKRGLSTGAIVGIVVGSLVGVLVLGAAGFFAYGAFAPKKATVTTVTSAPVPKPATTAKTTIPATESALPSAAPPAATADPGEYVVVTAAEAKAVVTQFLSLRAAKNIAGSKALCTSKMLAGPDADFVNDRYWNPDSFEITKLTPDQMYIHVTSMGMWPSGREPTIFSVYREPESGKVLIDGLLDPANSPELVTP